MSDKYTKKEELFCHKVVELDNQSAAYRLAYDAANMSDTTVWTESGRMMKKGKIARKVAELRAEASRKLGVTTQRVLQEKARLAFFDIRKLYRKDGTLKSIHELDDDTAAAVASFEVESKLLEPKKGANQKLEVAKTAKVKAYDKGHALDGLMRHLGMYEKDNVQKADAFSQLLITMGSINGTSDKA